MRLDLIAGCLIALLGANVSAAKPAPVDWSRYLWGDLAQLIGTNDYGAVLNDPRVSREIDALIGADRPELVTRLDVHSRVGFASGCLVLRGNQSHRGGEDMAQVNVCLSGIVFAAIKEGERFRVYAETRNYSHLPWDMRLWIAALSSGRFFKQPDNVEFVDAN